MNKFLSVLFLALLCSGCFWVLRVPMPKDEKFSNEGECTNRVWMSLLTDMETKIGCQNELWKVYPLISLRVYMTCHLGAEDDIPLDKIKDTFPDRHYTGEDIYKIKWQRRMRWAQYGIIWIGSPIDAVIDTILLPYDIFKD